MLPGDDKKYNIGLDPLSPLWDKFLFLKNIELYERSLREPKFGLRIEYSSWTV